jgi:hypothetical protein
VRVAKPIVSDDDGRQRRSDEDGPTAEIMLSDEERQTLERWARRPKSAQALALRCRIVLAAAEGELPLAHRGGMAPEPSGDVTVHAPASPGCASMACTTNPVPASAAPSPTRTWSG